MAFSSTVQAGVDLAFDLAGDLATEVKFINGTVGDYNFATQSVTVTDSDTDTVTGIVERTRRTRLRGADRPVLEARVIFKKGDVGNIDAYDTAKFNSQTWRLSTYEDDGYTVTATLIAEV